MSEAPVPAPKPIDVATARRASLEFAPTRAITRPQQELVNSLREKSRIDPDTALQMMAGRTLPDRAVAQLFADGQIGPDHYELDAASGFKDRTRPTAGARPGEAHEVARANEMQTRINEAYDFVENGAITPRAQAEVLRALYRDPGARLVLAEYYPNIDAQFASIMANPATMPATLRNAMNDILRNREYSGAFQDVINEAIKTDAELEQKTLPIRMKIDDLSVEIGEINDALNPRKAGSMAQKVRDIQTQLVEFDRTIDPATRVPRGLQARELIRFDGDIATARADLTTQQALLQRLQGDLSAEQANTVLDPMTRRYVPNDPVEISRLRREIGIAQSALSTAQSTLANAEASKQQLLTREQEMQQQQQKLQEDIAEKKRALREKQRELREEQAKLAPLDRQRRQKELEFIEKVNGLFANATDRYMDARLQRVGKAYESTAAEQMQHEMHEIEERLREVELDRWWKDKRVGIPGVSGRRLPIGWKRRTIKVMDKVAVDNDYAALLATGKTRTVIDTLMRSEIEDHVRHKHGMRGGRLNAAQQKEVEAMLAELDKTHGAEITDKLMTYKFRTGKIRKEEAERLQMTPLGLGFIERNWDRSEALKAEIAKIAGEPLIGGKGPIDRLSRLPKKKLAAITGLIAFFLATGSILGGGVSGSFAIG